MSDVRSFSFNRSQVIRNPLSTKNKVTPVRPSDSSHMRKERKCKWNSTTKEIAMARIPSSPGIFDWDSRETSTVNGSLLGRLLSIAGNRDSEGAPDRVGCKHVRPASQTSL